MWLTYYQAFPKGKQPHAMHHSLFPQFCKSLWHFLSGQASEPQDTPPPSFLVPTHGLCQGLLPLPGGCSPSPRTWNIMVATCLQPFLSSSQDWSSSTQGLALLGSHTSSKFSMTHRSNLVTCQDPRGSHLIMEKQREWQVGFLTCDKAEKWPKFYIGI